MREPSPHHSLDVPAPPWSYNPSSWLRRIRICVLAGVAFAISAYLALYQWRLIGDVWDPLFGEQTRGVLDSDVSHRMQAWLGVPDAALGALAYLGDVVFGLAGSTRRWQYRPWLVALFGLLVIPVGGVSALLVLTQFAVLGQRCFLCLIVATISLTLVYLAYGEIWSSFLYLRRVWRRTGSWWRVWRVFCGRYDPAGEAVALEVN